MVYDRSVGVKFSDITENLSSEERFLFNCFVPTVWFCALTQNLWLCFIGETSFDTMVGLIVRTFVSSGVSYYAFQVINTVYYEVKGAC